MIKVWVIVAHLIFANGSDEVVIGHHTPEWTSQAQCEESVPEQIEFLRTNLPDGTHVELFCKEQVVGPARDAA